MQSHTVQMELLRCIARDGHVYGLAQDFGAIVSSNGVPRPRLVGIAQASTFTGFCARHDDELFASIEKSPIVASAPHACLLAYRALCRELHAKEGAVLLDSHRRTMDRGLPVSEQIAFQRANSGWFTGYSTAAREIREQKQRYDDMIAVGDYSSVRFCVVWFAEPPDVMCSSWMNPDWDFTGNRLQNPADISRRLEGISLSLVASQGQGCAVFSWLAEEDAACESLLESLLGLRRDRIPDAVVRLAVSSFENQFWRPDWWESLDSETQGALLNRFIVNVHPFTSTPSDYLCDDGRRAVDWRVTKIDTNDNRLAKWAE